MKIVIDNLASSLLRIINRILAYISLEWTWKVGHLAGGKGGRVVFSFSRSENDNECLVW